MNDSVFKTKNSIANKLFWSNVSVIVIAFVIVFVVVTATLGLLVTNFVRLSEERSTKVMGQINTTSDATKEKIRGFYEESMRSKGTTMLSKDVLAIRPYFIDNSFNSVRDFITHAFTLDSDIVQAAFFTSEGDTIKAWQYVNRKYPTGLGTVTKYNKGTRAWTSEVNGRKVSIPDPDVAKIARSGKTTVKRVDIDIMDASGRMKSIAAYDCWIPVFNGLPEELAEIRADGEAIGYLRYVISLEKMQSVIAAEEKTLADALKEQESENATENRKTVNIAMTSIAGSLIFLALAALAIVFGSSRYTRRISIKITKPIAELKSSAEVIAGGDYSIPVEATSDDEIGVLSRAFESMRAQVKDFTEHLQDLVQQRTAELAGALETVTAQKKKIQEIMEHIEQGILTFGPDLTVDSEFSRFVATFYNVPSEKVAGSNVFDLVLPEADLSGDSMNTLQECIKSSVGEDCLSWELNSDHLVRETRVRIDSSPRVIGLDWKAIVAEDNSVQRVMLSIRDLTKQRALEAKVAEEKQKADRMMTLVGEILKARRKNLVRDFIRDSVERAQIARDSVVDDRSELNRLFRELHTIKGGARSLGLVLLKDVSHWAEECVQQVRDGKSAFDRDALVERVDGVVAAIEEYRRIMTDVLDDSESGNASWQRKSGGSQSITDCVMSQIDTIRNHIEDVGFTLAGINCEDNVISWKRDAFRDLGTIVLHSLNNAVDHGYVLPRQRGKTMDNVIKIRVSADVDGDFVNVRVADQGAGLDLVKLESVGKSRGFTPGPGQSWADAAFLDGVSTSESVTDSSGRGVGLSAVRAIAEGLGGTASLRANDPRGTVVLIRVPAPSVVDNRDSVKRDESSAAARPLKHSA